MVSLSRGIKITSAISIADLRIKRSKLSQNEEIQWRRHKRGKTGKIG
jgi:hypothetical protein